MLRWTPSGAVAAPTTVQIRVQRRYPGRVRAGAPAPTRSLSPAELLANIEHFTEGLRGPRTAPCTGLVLSGADIAGRPDLPAALDKARVLGVEHVVLHVGEAPLTLATMRDLADRVDVFVVPLQPDARPDIAERTIRTAHTLGVRVSTNTVLRAAALPLLDSTVDALLELRPVAVTLSHPFPTGTAAETVAPLENVRRALDDALPRLRAAGLPVRLKGLPACHLGPHAAHLGRTANRWYVDAEHQREDALLFLPDVLSFHKDDVCRFCSADPVCDGSFAAWLALPGSTPLRPITSDIPQPH